MNNQVLITALTIIGILLSIYSVYLQRIALRRGKRAARRRVPFLAVALNSLVSALKSTMLFLGNRKKLAGLSLTILAAVLWGVSNVSLRFLTKEGTDPLFISSTMLIIGSIVCFVLSYAVGRPAQGQEYPTNPVLTRRDIVLIVGGNSVNFVSFLLAVSFITSSQVIILNKINPLFVLLLLSVFLKERVSKASIASIVATLCGMYILLNIQDPSVFFRPDSNLVGSFLAIAAGFSFAVFTIGLYRSESFSGRYPLAWKLRAMGYVLLYSYIPVVTLTFFLGYEINYDPLFMLIIVLNGIRLAVIYVVYQQAIRLTHPIFVSVVVSLEVVFTILFEIIWLKEEFPISLFLGALLIMGAIWSVMIENSRLESRYRPPSSPGGAITRTTNASQ